MPCPTVVLLAGRSGAGKSTFAPYLARRLGGVVLDSDDLFTAPRRAVGEATGLGLSVVNDPIWRGSVHPRLLSLLLSLAACAASTEHPVVAVSPFTGVVASLERLVAGTAGVDVRWRWVVLVAEPGICRCRISERGWEMDAAKLANWENYDQACLTVAPGSSGRLCRRHLKRGSGSVAPDCRRSWGMGRRHDHSPPLVTNR
ncbi:MAG: AAA family ATPase [Acidimicrobiales bacterium]